MSDDPAVRQSNMETQPARVPLQTRRAQTTILLLVILLLASFGLRVYRLGDKSV